MMAQPQVSLIPAERIERPILLIRGQKVLLDSDLARKLEELEKKYDAQFKIVFDAIRQLMTPPPNPSKKRIGFHVRPDEL